jgi:hypothetical protein
VEETTLAMAETFKPPVDSSMQTPRLVIPPNENKSRYRIDHTPSILHNDAHGQQGQQPRSGRNRAMPQQ